MNHETHKIEPFRTTSETVQWLKPYQAALVPPPDLSAPTTHFGIRQPDCDTLIFRVGDTLCWDGTHVRVHSSPTQRVESCDTMEERMLKFGTGQITVPDDREDGTIVRTAAALTDEQRAAILSEGEAETSEGE
ncbi:hypothetical protein [Streptomyces sp. cg35]|uniref:hypothetical protein n=1 Tax=Streptomyces sp. cg35 TaxID=3421650 RepID=UPI003D16FC54